MRPIVGMWMIIALTLLWIVANWRYADWKHWRKYYPTILFAITWDFANTILTYQYSLWHYEKTLITPSHTVADFMIAFIHLPLIALLYLSRYPYKSRVPAQLAYIAFWAAINSMIELAFVLLKLMTYQHNWTIWWSVLLWILMFIVFRIHHTRPLLAWLVCICFTAIVVIYFHIPISQMK